VYTIEGSGRWLAGPIISPDGTVFVSHDNTIEQLDLETGRVVRTFEGHTSNAGNLALSADGATLASSETWDLAVWIWDVDTGTARRFPGPYATFVRDVALSPDASSDSNAFFVYDTESGEHVRAFGGERSCKLTFSADGTKLLSAAGDGIYLWSVTTGKQLLELPSHYGARSIALSPDGSLAVIGGAKGTIRLYNTASGQLVRSLEGSTGHIYGLAFSPGGALLASGGQDRMVRLWDVRTGTLLESLEGHTAAVRYLSFSSDGAVLGSGGNDGTVRLWGVPPTD
jgi:WD40 repeat protein